MKGVVEFSVPQHEYYCDSSKGRFTSCGSCGIGEGDSRDSGTAGNSGDSNSGGDSRDSNSADSRASDSGGDVRDSPLSFTKPFLAKLRETSGGACGNKVTSAPEHDSACVCDDAVSAAPPPEREIVRARDGSVTGPPERDSGGTCDGRVTSASEHKETSYSSKTAQVEATQDPRVSCVVECNVLLVNRHLTCIYKLGLQKK